MLQVLGSSLYAIMDLSLTALSLSQRKTEFLSLEGVDDVGGEDTFELSLVGRFLTDRSINFNFMRDRLSHLWRPGKGVCISELANQWYIFKFFHVVDLKRVLAGGPWTYDNHLLILHWIQLGECPNQIPINSIDIWVQIFDLPSSYMSESVGKQLGDYIGFFLEYDNNNNGGSVKEYMRLRVSMDVRPPLKRGKRLRTPKGDSFFVSFKYERLSLFCFICGCLGHLDRFCPLLFTIPEEEITRGWGVWLKAIVRQISRPGFNPWLRTNQGHQLELAFGGYTTAERRRIGAVMAQENQATPTDQGHKEQLAVVTEERVCMDEVDEGGTILQASVVDEDEGLQLLADRKKRKAGPSLEAQIGTMTLDKPNVDNTDMQTSPPPRNHENPLLAGPAGQACPFQ